MRKDKIVHFETSGTLGDLYIVALKLYKFHNDTGYKVKLTHHSIHNELFKVIDMLYYYFPFTQISHNHCESLNDVKENVERSCKKNNYIHTNSDNKKRLCENKYLDPENILMDPFPIIKFKTYNFKKTKKKLVGIQLH